MRNMRGSFLFFLADSNVKRIDHQELPTCLQTDFAYWIFEKRIGGKRQASAARPFLGRWQGLFLRVRVS